MYRLVQRRGIIGLFCLLFVASSVVPGWAQKDNRFEVSKNLDFIERSRDVLRGFSGCG